MYIFINLYTTSSTTTALALKMPPLPYTAARLHPATCRPPACVCSHTHIHDTYTHVQLTFSYTYIHVLYIHIFIYVYTYVCIPHLVVLLRVYVATHIFMIRIHMFNSHFHIHTYMYYIRIIWCHSSWRLQWPHDNSWCTKNTHAVVLHELMSRDIRRSSRTL